MAPILKITKKNSIFGVAQIRILRRLLMKRSQTHLINNPIPMAIVAFDYIGNEISINGIYELEELEGIFDLLKNFRKEFELGTACDIGANIGNHSRYFATKFKKVVSFEPNSLIIDILKFNTKLFSNIIVFENAIGDYEGTALIFGSKLNIGGFSALRDRNRVAQEYADYEFVSNSIKVITLDSMQEHLENLQFIKIDVEGYEKQVIDGAIKCIFKFKPIIAFEQWPSDFVDSKSKVIETLVEMGYEFYWQTNFSLSRYKKIRFAHRLLQTIIGTKKVFINNSVEVPPGHYSLLVAVHKSRTNKVKLIGG